jgi:hypothetical protein
LAKSPSLSPRPVKSKRKTAKPRSHKDLAIRFAAKTSFEPVKHGYISLRN